MEQQDGTGAGRHARGRVPEQRGHHRNKAVRDKAVQGQAGMTQGGNIRFRVTDRFLQHGQVLLEGRILDITQVIAKHGRIPKQGGKKHVMDSQRNLGGTDGLFPAAQEKGNICRAGAYIQDHETAAGILGRAKTEISPQGGAFRRKGDQGHIFRNRETAFQADLLRQLGEEGCQPLASGPCHFIRNGETPAEGGSTVRTGLEGSHQHDLMQAEGNGTAFFLLPFEAGIEGA